MRRTGPTGSGHRGPNTEFLTLPRYVDRHEDEDLDGLADKRLGQVSARRAPADEVVRTEALYRERYDGWNVKHFHCFYRREHAGTAGAASVPPSRA